MRTRTIYAAPTAMLSAVEKLEQEILWYVVDNSLWEDEWFFNFRAFDHVADREIVRGLCRSMRNRGLMRYKAGLFSEDGMVAGGGYGTTRKGRRYLAALEEVMSLRRRQDAPRR